MSKRIIERLLASLKRMLIIITLCLSALLCVSASYKGTAAGTPLTLLAHPRNPGAHHHTILAPAHEYYIHPENLGVFHAALP